MYPQERIATFIEKHFIPARVHVRDQPQEFQRLGERYGALWTPTILGLDADGKEHHRIEGFLEPEEFLAQLKLGLGKIAFNAKRWDEAQRFFQDIVDRHEDTDAAPEALYRAGAARYKATGDARALAETAAAFGKRYQGSTWATKASVWKPPRPTGSDDRASDDERSGARA